MNILVQISQRSSFETIIKEFNLPILFLGLMALVVIYIIKLSKAYPLKDIDLRKPTYILIFLQVFLAFVCLLINWKLYAVVLFVLSLIYLFILKYNIHHKKNT